jgi:hypothetical protein
MGFYRWMFYNDHHRSSLTKSVYSHSIPLPYHPNDSNGLPVPKHLTTALLLHRQPPLSYLKPPLSTPTPFLTTSPFLDLSYILPRYLHTSSPTQQQLNSHFMKPELRQGYTDNDSN